MMQLGSWRLETIRGGRFWLDAGVMYGIVPKTVWQTVTPPDEQNLIPFAIHCILARNGRDTVLIDTGYGGKMSPLERRSHATEGGDPVVESLAAMGLTPGEITHVVFTHLHWDHVGGATQFAEDRRLIPAFPNAMHFVNRMEWQDATSGAPELGGAYAPETFAALETSGQLTLVDGEVEILNGLWTRVTGGHTRGHQAIVFESQGETALYPGDLCPVTTHLRRMWCAAYDVFPLETRRRKPELLGAAADGGWWMLWDHDLQWAVSKLERHKSREFVICQQREQL
jgi:glyoxylase-like metal-dependent hydrolase (beta-lactamase superfamily II)